MAGTSLVHFLLAVYLTLDFSLLCLSLDNNSTKSKRQIFREQVNPQAGGRIPEDAFRSDRLALNRLNKEGIAVPDGVVLEARHRESHYGSYRHDPDIQASIVKVVLGEDGRYAPPEGRYPFNSLVESTYVLRPPINTPVITVPPRRPHITTLRLPARPFFQQDATVNSVDQQIELFNSFDPNFSGAGLWTGLLGPVPDVPNRLLRRQAKIPAEDVVAQHSTPENKVSESHASRGKTVDREHSNYNGQPISRTLFDGRSLQIIKHPYRYISRPTYATYVSSSEGSSKKQEEYDNGLVPVYLTPTSGSSKGQNYISYISPDSKFNFHHILPVVNVPLSSTPSYYYPLGSEQSKAKPQDKTVENRPHYPPKKEDYKSSTDKKLIPLKHKTNIKSEEDEEFHRTVQNPKVASALFEEQKNYDNRHQEISNHNYQDYAALEESFPKLPDPTHSNHHSSDLKQNVLVPVSLTHNQPTEQQNDYKSYNYIKPNTESEQENYQKELPPNQNSHYQLINSFSNFNYDQHSNKPNYEQNYHPSLPLNNNNQENSAVNQENQYQENTEINNSNNYHENREPNQEVNYQNNYQGVPPLNHNYRENEEVNQGANYQENRDEFRDIKYFENGQAPQHQIHENYGPQENVQPPVTDHDPLLQPPLPEHDQPPLHQNWHNPSDSNLKVINQGDDSDPNGVQYVRGGIQFEVFNDKLGVQSRGEVGQRNLQAPEQPNYRGSTQDLGSKHLNQVLHYIEPHEVVQQISTAPSIENEYPSLDTVPETSFSCQGPGRAMLPDPETSCQVFHLCGADGSKESFLCPKGARYDSHKQQCAPWTEVTCHA